MSDAVSPDLDRFKIAVSPANPCIKTPMAAALNSA
jgi:hypothetical protein